MVHAGLRYLATADATELTVGEQAECLRSLERANSAAPPRELAAGQS